MAVETRALEKIYSSIPELSPDQKTSILLAQRKLLSLQMTIHRANKDLEAANNDFYTLLSSIVVSLGLDPNDFSLDLGTLMLLRKHR